jgi:hypothetical protein
MTKTTDKIQNNTFLKFFIIFRTKLNLPHPATLRQYVSSVNCEPGFLMDVLKMLQLKKEADKLCNLVIDAMHIKTSIVTDNDGKVHGYCDFGGVAVFKPDERATEILVLMAVSLTGEIVMPIGYFVTASINGNVLAELINTGLTLCHEHHITVKNVTIDGFSSNYNALEILGCSLKCSKYDDIKTDFPHPTTNEAVYYTPDAVHNLKLARNTVGMYDLKSDDGIIYQNR